MHASGLYKLVAVSASCFTYTSGCSRSDLFLAVLSRYVVGTALFSPFRFCRFAGTIVTSFSCWQAWVIYLRYDAALLRPNAGRVLRVRARSRTSIMLVLRPSKIASPFAFPRRTRERARERRRCRTLTSRLGRRRQTCFPPFVAVFGVCFLFVCLFEPSFRELRRPCVGRRSDRDLWTQGPICNARIMPSARLASLFLRRFLPTSTIITCHVILPVTAGASRIVRSHGNRRPMPLTLNAPEYDLYISSKIN